MIKRPNISRGDIPWHRLTTPYGRGTHLSQWMSQEKYKEIAGVIEHQSTLWQVTPWVLLVMLERLEAKPPFEVTLDEVVMYDMVTEGWHGREVHSIEYVPDMAQLLDECYLWPEDDSDDEDLWEDEEPCGYDELAFYSYYYYSYWLLKEALPIFENIRQENPLLAEAITKFIKKI